MNKFTQQLTDQGFAIIDNVLPTEVAENVFNLFLQENDCDVKDQIRENHYEHVFSSTNPLLPGGDETYLAKFSRSATLSSNSYIKEVYDKYFFPLVKEVAPFEVNDFEPFCHKQDVGDRFRVHMDDYASSINVIYYVNKTWKWDWGGILNVCSHEEPEKINSIFPMFNRLVLLNSKVFKSPHFVSTVEPFSKNPRYSIVAFNT